MPAARQTEIWKCISRGRVGFESVGSTSTGREAPPKQRHTAKRIFERLRDEHGYTGGLTVVKEAARAWRQAHAEVFTPPRHHDLG